MWKSGLILAAIGVVIALPFALRREAPAGRWERGDPVLVIASPHNEAIRYEFGRAFSEWHRERHGRPVKVEWLSIGGTTEIARYLSAEFTADARAWWTRRRGREWPLAGGEILTSSRFPTDAPPKGTPAEEWARQVELYKAFRETDDPAEVTSRIDLFFGGGEFDHSDAFRRGLTVPPWPPEDPPAGLFEKAGAEGAVELIPERLSGETWRTPTLFGTAVSTFGICYNLDRLLYLGIANPPQTWEDVADPVYFGQIGVADPTKSGSIAKAFEMIIQQKCHEAVAAAGFGGGDIDRFEKEIEALRKTAGAGYKAGDVPPSVPTAYQQAVERGWEDGLYLVQRIGANARYFTDSASKVPIDVSVGDATVGMAIDFYARYQSQTSRGPAGEERMAYVTPAGGSSVSCDPISLLRGAPDREVAVRFIEFVLSEAGQRLWTYEPGTPGGPERYALRRLPIRRDFYPSDDPAVQAVHERHRRHAVDDLADPRVDPYKLAEQFTYRPRWTASHFGVHRELIRAMCIDSSVELQAAWKAIAAAGGPEKCPEAAAAMRQLPAVTLWNRATGQEQDVRLDWRTALQINSRTYDPLEYMREWVAAFRDNYRRAEELARRAG